jgi:hypothetical protein
MKIQKSFLSSKIDILREYVNDIIETARIKKSSFNDIDPSALKTTIQAYQELYELVETASTIEKKARHEDLINQEIEKILNNIENPKEISKSLLRISALNSISDANPQVLSKTADLFMKSLKETGDTAKTETELEKYIEDMKE